MSSGSLQLTALDHRAAVYEKTGQLQAALRDSKQMIDLKPELAKVRSVPVNGLKMLSKV